MIWRKNLVPGTEWVDVFLPEDGFYVYLYKIIVKNFRFNKRHERFYVYLYKIIVKNCRFNKRHERFYVYLYKIIVKKDGTFAFLIAYVYLYKIIVKKAAHLLF